MHRPARGRCAAAHASGADRHSLTARLHDRARPNVEVSTIMTRLPLTLSLVVLAALLSVPSQARPARTAPTPQPNPAVLARAAVMNRFTTRMERLDTLMGPTAARRSRSADAEH